MNVLDNKNSKNEDNKKYQTPATIDDPAILDEMQLSLEGIGLGKARK